MFYLANTSNKGIYNLKFSHPGLNPFDCCCFLNTKYSYSFDSISGSCQAMKLEGVADVYARLYIFESKLPSIIVNIREVHNTLLMKLNTDLKESQIYAKLLPLVYGNVLQQEGLLK